MTRPTILDLDLVVVPMEPNGDMRFAMDTDLPFTAYTEMLSASPYHTAWDDVRKYVEKLEVEAKCDEEYLDLVKDKYRAAEARIAELEKRMADAERVIEPFGAICSWLGVSDWAMKRRTYAYVSPNPDGSDCAQVSLEHFRAARAYMEGK
jgi:hypothetical protein